MGLLVPVTLVRVIAMFVALAIVPAWAIASRTRTSALQAFGLATALSPILFGAVVLLAMWLDLQSYVAAWLSVIVFAALYLFVGRASGVETNEAERRIVRGLLGVFGLAAVLALTLPLTNSWWQMRNDSWFHAAVFHRIQNHGVPPLDPYFASLRLQYMYFYHTLLVGVSELTSLGPFRAMILVNAAALFGCVFGFGYLASFFSRRVWPRVLGGVLVLFGMNGWFYAFYPIRVARALWGETTGAGVLAHFFPWSPVGHDTAIRLLGVEGNQVLLLDKFMLGTALSLTLGPLCVILGLLVSARRGRWCTAHAVLLALAVAGVLYLHAVIGAIVAVATLAVLVLMMMIRSHTDGTGPTYGALAVLVLVGMAAAVPYFYSVLPRGGGVESVRLAFQPGYVVGLLSNILPVLVLSIPFLRWIGKNDEWRTGGRAREEPAAPDETPKPPGGILMGRLFGELSLSPSGIVAMWTVIVFAAALVVDLPTVNETKFAFPLFLPLAAFAVGGINRMWETRRGRMTAVALVLSATVPLNAVYFHHAFRDASTFGVSDDEAATYRWIEGKTPADAVFLEDDDVTRVPALAARDLYWGHEVYAHLWGYPKAEMTLRRDVRYAVFSEAGPTREHLAALAALNRPVWLLCRDTQGDNFAMFKRFTENPTYRGRFVAGNFGVFEIDFAAAAAADTAATPDSP
jgi:hypothetical protein